MVGQNETQRFTRSFSWALVMMLLAGCFLSSSLNLDAVFASDVDDLPKPSVLEFTLEFVDESYYVAPTYTTDQYTGKTVMDKSGYTVEKKSIVVTIKNQAIRYNSFNDGTKCYLAYNVAVKGHYGEDWKEIDFANTNEFTMEQYFSEEFPKPSNSDYTILYVKANDYPVGAQLDVKVQARIGQESKVWATYLFRGFPMYSYETDGIVFDIDGDWSETQTISLGDEIPVTTPDDTATPEHSTPSDDTATSNAQGNLDFTWVPKDDESIKLEELAALLGIAAVFVAIAVVLVHFKLRKH